MPNVDYSGGIQCWAELDRANNDLSTKDLSNIQTISKWIAGPAVVPLAADESGSASGNDDIGNQKSHSAAIYSFSAMIAIILLVQ